MTLDEVLLGVKEMIYLLQPIVQMQVYIFSIQ